MLPVYRQVIPLKLTGALLAMTLALASCSAPAPTPTPPAPTGGATSAPRPLKGSADAEPDNGAPSDSAPDTPTPTAAATPGTGPVSLTADLGFRSDPHGFKFENGGGGNYNPEDPSTQFLTVQGMQRMFGDEDVCTGTTSGASCVPTPAAKQWMDQNNSSMNGGQCEGMAVLALSLFSGLDSVAALEAGPSKAFELNYNTNVRHLIGVYFAYQATENATKATVKGTPAEVLENLAPYFAPGHKDPVTLGFYGPKGGHATTPYAIEDKGGGIYHIKMYDNNWPGQERYIEVNKNANTWIYNFAATNPTEAADAWKGDAASKTLEFTPLSARLTKAPCPYCKTSSGAEPPSGNRQIMLDAGSSGKAHLRVVDKADPTKFVGWDPKTKQYVNTLAGASLKRDKSVLKAGDVEEEPLIDVPAGKDYEIKVDGDDLSAAEKVKVSIFGGGTAITVSDIDLDPDQVDTLTIKSDADSLAYKPGNSPDAESPDIAIAMDNPNGQDYAFEVDNLDAANGEELSFDLDGGRLNVGDSGATADNYDVKVNRVKDNGSEDVFSKDDVSLGSEDTDEIDFENWGGQGTSLNIGPEGQATAEADVDADAAD